MDYRKMAQETEQEIDKMSRGYYKWLELWAQEKGPYKIGETFHHGMKRITVKSITAGKIYGDIYEWIIVSEHNTRVTIPMKEIANEDDNSRK